MDEATQNQIVAADPAVSTWLSANAGSGKTRVLTDRVARLLLGGTPPQNILCLTYTKAAASEMQNRLFQRLGGWAMAADAGLMVELTALGVTGAPDLAAARRLFARAIETPGGLRIQTIHSFCASLLRRFPLEAGVPPNFMEMDDRAALRLREDCLESMARDHPGPLDDLLVHKLADLGQFVGALTSRRDDFARPVTEADLRASLDLAPTTSERSLTDAVLGDVAPDFFQRIALILAASDQKTNRATAEKMQALTGPWGLSTLAALETICLTQSGKAPFTAKIGDVPTKAAQPLLGCDLPLLDDLMLRIERARPARLALHSLDATLALHAFAAAFLPLYAQAKAARGLLDYDDLILRTRDLLTRADVADWVLYRLDGGIDHILVDEAQDTSPAQWDVIQSLTHEFGAGSGARDDLGRTLFVVGDRKQSIYSFQGADPRLFDAMFTAFGKRLAASGGVARREMRHSFRSAEAVLGLVDQVFADQPAMSDVRHQAFHTALPGRVDLWPLIAPPAAEDDPDFGDARYLTSPPDAAVQLAHAVATEVRRLIDGGDTIPDGTGHRAIHAGDILILVRRRKDVFHQVIRACKAQGIDIAGPDRMNLMDVLAVQDLAALLRFLALPEDDLSLAAALRSPLFGWSEQQLYTLASHRGEAFLWEALRDDPASAVTKDTLFALLKAADFLRPYDLLDRILIRHDGRRRLLARLGDEAADGIDELLSQALSYERGEIPSLTGFLSWLDAGEVEVRRQADARGTRLRVMTVHGAKGLEAPIVILPETMVARLPNEAAIMPVPDAPPMWRLAKDQQPPVMVAAASAMAEDAMAETARLLYVAMTRAEKWLIVCGAGVVKDTTDTWYTQTRDAMQTLGALPTALPTGPGLRHATGDWTFGPLTPMPPVVPHIATLPGWFDTRAPAARPLAEPINPSGLGGAKAVQGDGMDTEAAMARGTALHLLLERLPPRDPGAWPAAALALLADRADRDELLAEAASVLALPQMQADALTEVPFTATLGGQTISGTIDRLIVSPDAVLALDYKANTVVPASPRDVPDGLLRQMGTYLIALRQIYPTHRIDVAIVWTRTAQVMSLPHDAVTDALRAAGFLDGSS